MARGIAAALLLLCCISCAAQPSQSGRGPATQPRPIIALSPPEGFVPGRGLPIFDESGHIVEMRLKPGEWIFCGPFPRQPGTDHLAPLGGRPKANPELGTTVAFEPNPLEFRSLDPRAILRTDTQTGADLKLILPRPAQTTTYFFSILESRGGRLVKVSRVNSTSLWLAGRPIAQGDRLRLASGLYPVLVEVSVGPEPLPDPLLWEFPRFDELPEARTE